MTIKFLILFSLWLIADITTKLLAQANLPVQELIPTGIGNFAFILAFNDAGAFSLGQHYPAEFKRIFFPVTGFMSQAVMALTLFWASKRGACISGMGASMLFAGAFGNSLEQAVTGHATDFMVFVTDPNKLVVFNFADVCIFAGMGLIFWTLIQGVFKRHSTARAQSTDSISAVP